MRRALAPLALLLSAFVLLAPFAIAQDAPTPPDGATFVPIGGGEVAHWIGPDRATVDADVAQGETATLWVAFLFPARNATTAPANDTVDGNETAPGNDTAETNETPETNATVEPESDATYRLTVNVDAQGALSASPATLTLDSAEGWVFANATLASLLADAGKQDYAYNLTFSLQRVESDGNATLVATAASGGSVSIDVGALVPAPTPPGVPTTYYIVGGAAAVAVAVGAVLAVRGRRERARMNRSPRRSQALREEAMERAMTTAKKPEEKAAVVAEIRKEEKVRERRRELQILDAKKADALKSLDLLKKRHEAGGLTKLQYETMVAKKQADLDRIEAEIAEMEAQEGGPGAAA